MPTNQQLGVEMANTTPTEQKIHIQALHHPDPDFYDDGDEIKNMYELLVYYLTFQCKDFGNIYADFEDSTVLVNMIHNIMSDEKDDKLGRIRDEMDKKVKEVANFVYNNHEKNRWAKNIYDATIANII